MAELARTAGNFSYQKFSPLFALQAGLVSLEGILITISVVLTPALLAGSLAGEKTRNTLGLLLACLVSPREIVAARLGGRLSVVGIILLATIPAVVLLATFLGQPPAVYGTLLLLPAAIAFGGGGLAIAGSAVSRRGRDALLAVYLLDLLFLLVPVFGWLLPTSIQVYLDPLSPYHGIAALVESDPAPALYTAGIWLAIGLAGAVFAAWQVRPAYLRDAQKNSSRRWLFGRRRVPPVGDRPILWKELYVEHLRSLNRFVQWLAILIVSIFSGVSFVLVGMWSWATFVVPANADANWTEIRLANWMRASFAISWLLQWTMGLRAAVAIASERERATWDSLLLCPFEGRDIVLAKIYGSLYSLRWFAAVIILTWIASAFTGALTVVECVTLIADTTIIGMFTVAVGVWFSLYCSTATRAMTLTLVAWMLGVAITFVLAWMIVLAIALLLLVLQLALFGSGYPSGMFVALPGSLSWLEIGRVAVRLLCYTLFTFIITLYCRRNFDRLAGRAFDMGWPRRTRRRRRLKAAGLSRPTSGKQTQS
jgi:ABC-type transport system involved in multi-copper enzyme maturation permease subunit